jgi:hypothetical protein
MRDMRDMVALTILLAGFSPYFSHQLDPPSWFTTIIDSITEQSESPLALPFEKALNVANFSRQLRHADNQLRNRLLEINDATFAISNS